MSAGLPLLNAVGAMLGTNGAVDPGAGLPTTGESVLFWFVAIPMVAAASGLLWVRKAVHVALLMVFTMISLAIIYAAQEAQFLFAAQIVVYTGAVMMLFLFVLMLVGVDKVDSRREGIRNQRWVSLLVGAVTLGLMVVMFKGLFEPNLKDPKDQGFWAKIGLEELASLRPLPPSSLAQANAEGNPTAVATELFQSHAFALELTALLLIVAAVGAIVLTHRERIAPRKGQKELSQKRVRDGVMVAGLPAPGVFARHNSVDVPALLPDGTPAQESVSRVVKIRGQEASELATTSDVERVRDDLDDNAISSPAKDGSL